MELYVKLCAASPYLSDILTTNPGMIDELVDSLQLDQLPTRQSLSATLAELCRGASDTLPVLHDFKNAEHLRIGVRDILGKEDIDRTHEALADVAETCLTHVAELEYARLVEKYGIPTIGPGPLEGEPSRLVILGLGKLGGREPNYHSHLDVLFLYEADGTTRRQGHSRRQERTANNYFFMQLAQRIIKQLAEHTPKGRLYAVDALLRPIGVGGALALPLTEFEQHFRSGAAPLWQWQVLCQARPVFGDTLARERVANLLRQLIVQRPKAQGELSETRQSRFQLERGASANNLKRGPGGTLDVEFIVQLLQLQYAGARPDVLTTNTQAAIAALATAGALTPGAAETLGDSYRFLRRVESGLRLLDTSARHDLPEAKAELAQLALLLGHSNPERLRQRCLDAMAENRAQFEALTSE
jgi:glutamate-ammonia-ligase adenylyltransferase